VDRGRGVILGTAGHIDHGKTTLVRALTGVDTDRLPEEKRRGITIELGFAPLALDGVGTIGVVDVPGHEAFVRTMVAGATGIDLALVVIAADEGVMPQTREHLAILELLGVRRGVIALTKADLVDDDWLALVEDDARGATSRALPEAPIVATSVQSGRGIAELRAALADLARTIPARGKDDLFRLPIDRVFTIKGTGTVVTGHGLVRRAQSRRGRARASRRTNGACTRHPGSWRPTRGRDHRGENRDCACWTRRRDVPRGSSLVTDTDWHATMSARADVTIVPDVDVEIRPRTWFRFHVGTAEVGVRVVSREVAHGAPFAARLAFDEPVVLRAGDRFVIRTSAPLNTIAGGVIADPYAPKRARPWPAALSTDERFRRIVDEGGSEGVAVPSLPVRLGETPASCAALRAAADSWLVQIGERLILRSSLDELETRLVSLTMEHHVDHPLEPGIPVQALRAHVRWSPEFVGRALQRLGDAGTLANHGGVVAVAGWVASPSTSQSALMVAILDRLESAGAEPPSEGELSGEFGVDTPAIIRFLERRGDVVQVEPDRYYTTGQLKRLLDKLRSSMAGGTEFSPSQIRDALGLSRKFLIPFLEYTDRIGYTNRTVTGRVWRAS
jgi:selenocysteine-specific elongation factor